MATPSKAPLPSTDQTHGDIVHGSYWPMDLRQDSGVKAQIEVQNDVRSVRFETPLWRISPLGAEFSREPSYPPLEVGDVVDIGVHFRGQGCQFYGIVVSMSIDTAGRKLVGLRWCENEKGVEPIKSRRQIRRWICSQSFLPTAVAPNPLMYNDMVLFRLVDVSKGGARLLTSMRNKFILPGMQFGGVFAFPMVGSANATMKVKWTDLVSQNGKQELALGVEFVASGREMDRLMGEYILQFGDNATVKDIRDSGLIVRTTARAVDISYARTEKDYREVLALRKMAYEIYKRGDEEIAELSDIFDSRSRIMVARHHGRIVGSTRIIYHDADDVLEQAQYGRLPDTLPRNDELVELTRNCTHPDYRASDLLYEILRHALVAMIQAKRRYIMSSSPDHLLKFYLKLGIKQLGVTTSPKSCPDLKLHVLFGDLTEVLRGIGVNPIVWLLVFEDILPLAVENGYVRLDTMTRLRLRMFRMLKPVARFLMKRRDKKLNKVKKPS